MLPFSVMGCRTVGVDINVERVSDARKFFRAAGADGEFVARDILEMECPDRLYDVIICHDVIEHIADKQGLLGHLGRFLKSSGIVFIAFPAWQMPFGGHQQICRSRALSHLPFVHLLPSRAYRSVLGAFGESGDCIDELLQIKKTGISVERFEKLVRNASLTVKDRQLWLVNPHYETKFGLRPRRLDGILSAIPYLRDFMSTSCFYILAHGQEQGRCRHIRRSQERIG